MATMRPQEWGGGNWYRRNLPSLKTAFPSLSATPPTVTDLGNVATTMPTPKVWTLTAPANGATVTPYALIYGANRFIVSATRQNSVIADTALVGSGAGLATVAQMVFNTDAPTFELVYYGKGVAQPFRMYVDGELCSATDYTLNGAGNTASRFTVAFTSGVSKPRRVHIVGLAPIAIVTNVIDTVWCPEPPRVRVCWFTDSYGQSQGYDAFHFIASRLLGWEGVDMNTFGGTGYNNGGAGTSFQFANRAADVITGQYDVVVVTGGINDVVTNLQTQTAALFDQLAAGMPNAKLIAVGPWTPGSQLVSTETPKRDAIAAAMTTRGMFIDPTLWITGTGNVGAPAGDGNADRMIVAGGTHPTREGALYVGARVASDIAARLAV